MPIGDWRERDGQANNFFFGLLHTYVTYYFTQKFLRALSNALLSTAELGGRDAQEDDSSSSPAPSNARLTCARTVDTDALCRSVSRDSLPCTRIKLNRASHGVLAPWTVACNSEDAPTTTAVEVPSVHVSESCAKRLSPTALVPWRMRDANVHGRASRNRS